VRFLNTMAGKQQLDEEATTATRKHELPAEEPDEEMRDVDQVKKKQKNRPHHLLHQATLRKPSWTYFHLQLFSTRPTGPLDIVSAKGYLSVAMQRFLGLHGLAIPVDILKLDGQEIWIRAPREDGSAVHEALSGWVGNEVKWNVKGRDDWLVRLAAGDDGQNLFKVSGSEPSVTLED